MKRLILILLLGFSFGQYDFNLEDLNSSSTFYGEFIGPSNFQNQVNIIYFGHFN